MIGIFIGIGAILLGLRGFTRDGLPLTRKKRLTGTPAKVIGVICLLVGLALIADGVYMINKITQQTP